MSGRTYGKRRREEPESDENDDDSDLDEEEREAMKAFKREGFNEALQQTEESRKKKVDCCVARAWWIGLATHEPLTTPFLSGSWKMSWTKSRKMQTRRESGASCLRLPPPPPSF